MRRRNHVGLRLRAQVSAVETEYGMVLLDEAEGRYWQLNGPGVRVIRTLLDGGTVEDAATDLAAEYDVTPDQASSDVAALLAELRGARLVTS
jgi:hypothetical protein